MFKFEAFFAFWPRENLDGAQKMGRGGKGREQKNNYLPTPPISCLALILVPPKEKNASKIADKPTEAKAAHIISGI